MEGQQTMAGIVGTLRICHAATDRSVVYSLMNSVSPFRQFGDLSAKFDVRDNFVTRIDQEIRWFLHE